LKVAGENVAGIGLTNNKVYDFLRGSKGTKAELEILRRGVSEPLHFSVVRDKIPINSVDAAYEPEDGILYIKLSRFAAPSHSEIVEAFSKASKPLKGVIMDLRSNSGGYLPTAISIANEFLQAGDLIVYTDGRAMPRMQENADGSGLYTRGPLVVMIDENSASASEILAGAIQDQDRGIIVGRRSFGKGLVQNAIPLDDGSELRLTVARYHTPSGRVIQSPYQEGNS
jgi:carboxyl-terminal processing protease